MKFRFPIDFKIIDDGGGDAIREIIEKQIAAAIEQPKLDIPIRIEPNMPKDTIAISDGERIIKIINIG